MENHLRYFETMAAAERTGLYYTCINSYLTPEEVAYIVDDCDATAVHHDARPRPTSPSPRRR